MPTLIEQYQSEDVSRDLKEYARRIDQISDQRLKTLQNLSAAQVDEKANVEAFIADLDNVSVDQIRSENRTKIRGFARKQYKNFEVDAIAGYLIGGADNQNLTTAEILDFLVDQVAIEQSSDFTTLMTAITAANTLRNA